MLLSPDHRNIGYTIILFQIVLLLSSSAINRCLAGNKKISRFRVGVDLINPSHLRVDGNTYQVVVLDRIGDHIKCYHYDDPDRTRRLYLNKEIKIKNQKDDYVEGYLISDSDTSITLLLTQKARIDVLEKHHIQMQEHNSGILITIPISEIRKIKAWKKVRQVREWPSALALD